LDGASGRHDGKGLDGLQALEDAPEGGVGGTGFKDNQGVDRASEHRTLHQTWCTEEECDRHLAHRRMVERISSLRGIPDANFESTQISRYKFGEHYELILLHLFLLFGPQILTAFVYLNEVEEGGGTEFPILNIMVVPKPGRAILWPSVLDEAPNKLDPRAALPVVKGRKYGANIWVSS
jgi:prolyl 4-hydroxylase